MTSAAPGTEAGEAPVACPSCAAQVLAGWRHCGTCGFELGLASGPERVHEVTVVVSDLQGSTALAEALDPESLRLVLDRYFNELGAVLESYGGRIEKRIGDMMVTVFGLPDAHPGDALRALQAVAEAQQTLAALNVRLEATWGVRLANRTGVASGTVVYAGASGAHRLLVGDALELASALEPVAPALEALVAESTTQRVGADVGFGPAVPWVTRSGASVVAAPLVAVPAATNTARPAGPVVDGGCAWCGAAVAPEHAWCTACGRAVTRRTRPEDRRNTLTIVFVDLEVEPVGPPVDAVAERGARVAAFRVVRAALEAHGGIVERSIGDAVMAVYGLDRRHDDDALRAARAALEVQDRLFALADELAERFGMRAVVRMGVNTGPVIAGDPTAGERLVTGDAVNVAARLEQTAYAGAVIVGEQTRRLLGAGATVVELEPLPLKGKAEPVAAYRLLELDGEAGSGASGFELPLVGRDGEVARLEAAWAETMAAGSWGHVALHGEAGVGKSRLVLELLDRLGPSVRVLRGVCLPYGEGITFWPVAEVLRQAAGLTAQLDVDEARRAVEAVAPDGEVAWRLCTLLGLDARVVPVAELFWAVRRMLEHLAGQRPTVLVIDGLHWAEPTLLELLDDVVQLSAPVPALLITMSRAPSEQAEDDDAGALDVGPLDEGACDALITLALGEGALPPRLRSQIVKASAGVPLFVEQLLTMLIDDGRLVQGPSGWLAPTAIDELSVPPTVEAILAARVDALPPDEGDALGHASVIGQEFARDALEHLSEVPDLRPELASLRQRQLVADVVSSDGRSDHRFRNLLIRDVVYDGLLKRTRSVLHRRFGEWLVAGSSAGRALELEEIVGYHLERAYRLGVEVAPPDDELIEVGRRAALLLGAAGERAFARGDMPAAANLLERAAGARYGGGAEAARLLVVAGDARFELGTFEDALAVYRRAERVALEADDRGGVAHARLAMATQRYLTGDGVSDEAASEAADEAEAVLAALDDHAGIARCWRLRAYLDLTHCQWGAAEQAAEETLAHARRAGDHVLERRVQPALAGFSLHGPTPVPEALARCQELLVEVGDDRRARALIQRSQAHLLALDGALEEARALCAATRDSLLELGWAFDSALVSLDLGPIELLAGRIDDAERELRRDYEALRSLGERNYLSTTTYLLAEAVRRSGRGDEAAALVAEAAEIAAEDDLFSQAGWRSVQARLLADAGELDGALAMAEEVATLVASTDGLSARGDAALDVAHVHSLRGDVDAARGAALDARSAYGRKGHRLGHAEADAVLRALPPTPVGAG